MWRKDPKTGKKSVTLTFALVAFVVCMTKFTLSGIKFGSLELAPFVGSDFVAVFGTTVGAYIGRKFTDKSKDK